MSRLRLILPATPADPGGDAVPVLACLRRGVIVSVADRVPYRPGSGLTYLALALAAGAAAGGWCAVLDSCGFGLAAAQSLGADLGRVLLVDAPAERWGEALAVLSAAMDTVLVRAPARPSAELLLLLPYAQWPAAISRLTTGHIQETAATVRIRLGDVAVVLPGPVAELALQQARRRPRGPRPDRRPGPPRRPAGPTDQHLDHGRRLRKLGIRLAETRSTALFQLATELPSAILSRTLDVHISVAVKWQRAAAGDWAAHAADVRYRARKAPAP